MVKAVPRHRERKPPHRLKDPLAQPRQPTLAPRHRERKPLRRLKDSPVQVR